MNKYVAEAFGTFVLVFFGVGSAVLAGGDIGFTGISFAFGIAVIAMAYSIGQISGAHLNPAVSMGALVAGRIDMKDFIGYCVSQTIGAIIAAAIIYIIATGKTAGYDVAASGLGQNGWGPDYLGGFNMMAAFTFEVVANISSTDNSGSISVTGVRIAFAVSPVASVTGPSSPSEISADLSGL